MIKDVYTVIHYDWFKPEPVVKSAYSTSSLDAARKILEEKKWILDHYLFADEETFEIIHSTYVPSTTV